MRYALVDCRMPREASDRLFDLGFTTVALPPCPTLPEPLSAHPDMLLFLHGDTLITTREYFDISKNVLSPIIEEKNLKLILTDEVHGKEYPYDAIFNSLVIGDKIFIKSDTGSRAVIEYAKSCGLKPVHTRQGYPACTVLSFGNVAITSDEGMIRTLSAEGIDTHLISVGDISLFPYEYGFIGGATGVFDKEVFFIGDLNTHRSRKIIREAIIKEGYTPISLDKAPLRDLGRILFIG